MAQRLTPKQQEVRARLRAEFNADLRDVPCQYCGTSRSKPVEVVPAVYVKDTLVKQGHFADLCWECMRGLGLWREDRETIRRAVKLIEDRKRWAREDQRKAMKANQVSMFDADVASRDPLRGK